ncbi:hypothetical protein FRB93_001120 [Tulasnella sp. JGI-2019a]|nr:hypothetical protein FRB93_001120 [Tulasnella sp. JGI-2019a]
MDARTPTSITGSFTITRDDDLFANFYAHVVCEIPSRPKASVATPFDLSWLPEYDPKSNRMCRLRGIAETVPMEKLTLSLYHILRLPVYKVDNEAVPDDLGADDMAFLIGLADGCRLTPSIQSLALHLFGEGLAHKLIHGAVSCMDMPDVEYGGDKERSRRNRVERLALKALDYNTSVDLKLWAELLTNIGKRGGPEVMRISEMLIKKANVEAAATHKEVQRVSTSDFIKDDLATKFIEEAQAVIQQPKLEVLDVTCTTGEAQRSILPPMSPSDSIPFPVQVATSGWTHSSPTMEDREVIKPASFNSSTLSSVSSVHRSTPEERRFFVTNPDASLSLESVKLSYTVDGDDESVSAEVPSLVYQCTLGSATCSTPNDSKKSFDLEYDENESSHTRSGTGVKGIFTKMLKRFGRRAAVRRISGS